MVERLESTFETVEKFEPITGEVRLISFVYYIRVIHRGPGQHTDRNCKCHPELRMASK